MATIYEAIKWFRVFYQTYCSTYASTQNNAIITLNEAPTNCNVDDALIQQTENTNQNIGNLSNDQVYAPTVMIPPNPLKKTNYKYI